jgi:hypothetical protein
MADRPFFRRRIFAATALVPAAVAICLRFGFSAALLDSAIHDAQLFRNHSVKLRQAFTEKLDVLLFCFNEFENHSCVVFFCFSITRNCLDSGKRSHRH